MPSLKLLLPAYEPPAITNLLHGFIRFDFGFNKLSRQQFQVDNAAYLEGLILIASYPVIILFLMMLLLLAYYCCISMEKIGPNKNEQTAFYCSNCVLFTSIMLMISCLGVIMYASAAPVNGGMKVVTDIFKDINTTGQAWSLDLNPPLVNILKGRYSTVDETAFAKFRKQVDSEMNDLLGYLAEMGKYLENIRFWSITSLSCLVLFCSIISLVAFCCKSKATLIASTSMMLIGLVLSYLCFGQTLMVNVAVSDFCINPKQTLYDLVVTKGIQPATAVYHIYCPDAGSAGNATAAVAGAATNTSAVAGAATNATGGAANVTTTVAPVVALPLIVGGGIGRQLGLPLGGGSGSGSGDGGSPFDDEDVDDDDTAGYDGAVKGRAGRSEIDLTRLPQFVADLLADTGGKGVKNPIGHFKELYSIHGVGPAQCEETSVKINTMVETLCDDVNTGLFLLSLALWVLTSFIFAALLAAPLTWKRFGAQKLNHHDNSSIDDEDEVFLPSSPTSRNMHRTRNPRFISQHTPTASLRGSFERLNLDATRASVEFSPASRGMIDGVDKPPPYSPPRPR